MLSAPGPGYGHQCGAVPGAPPSFFPGMSNHQCGQGHIPEVSGIGRTLGEEATRQAEFAWQNRLFEPQEIKPADEDPSRMYYCRELDGNWTQRSRFSIDHMDDMRWFVTEAGWFYAVRQAD